MENFAAQAGARSSDWTLCFAVAALKTRRLIYGRLIAGVPGIAGPNLGDCNTNDLAPLGTTVGIAAGLGTAAKVDPEPISQGILSGLATIFGGFGAAHAQAVKKEEDTLCDVAGSYNKLALALEQAVATNSMSADQAAAAHGQLVSQLDSVCARIYKSCNASCGFRIALKALGNFVPGIVYPALAPHSIIDTVLNPIESIFEPVPSAPINGNNFGVGPTASAGIPSQLPIGSIILIGGVAFIASKL
jgi:hypothetical protein